MMKTKFGEILRVHIDRFLVVWYYVYKSRAIERIRLSDVINAVEGNGGAILQEHYLLNLIHTLQSPGDSSKS